MPSKGEQWRQVPGWPEYEVSDAGRVRSVTRTITRGDGVEVRLTGKVLAPATSPEGYQQVGLCRAGAVHHVGVHRLVYAAFHGPIPKGLHVDHINGNPADNQIFNLRVVTPAENIANAIRLGRHVGAREVCPRGHRLAHPNLRVDVWEQKGWRSCLACYFTHHDLGPGMGWSVKFKRVSDTYYRQFAG